MKKSVWTTLATLVSVAALSIGLAGCGNTNSAAPAKSDTASTSSKAKDAKATKDTGSDEIPIGDTHAGPLNVSAVYFQPVDMYPVGTGLSAAESNMHLEADIHALKDNKLGYNTDQYVPNCTVKYSIVDKKDPSNKQEGTFMQMNADDGPHYGANVKLDKAGEYTLTLTIYSPATNGWALHIDKATGVKGRFWTEPLKVSFDWHYVVHQW